MPNGWGSTELAEDRARRALEAWDAADLSGPYLHKALAVADSLRRLLAELKIDKEMRRA